MMIYRKASNFTAFSRSKIGKQPTNGHQGIYVTSSENLLFFKCGKPLAALRTFTADRCVQSEEGKVSHGTVNKGQFCLINCHE
jgi:hypothetical protein